MADGTFDLAMVEGYTYCAGCGDWPASGNCCPTKGTEHIEQFFDRLDFARTPQAPTDAATLFTPLPSLCHA